jgi:hypothetical protein
LFEEPGTLDQALASASAWFDRHIGGEGHERTPVS